MRSSDFVSVETCSGGPSIWPASCKGGELRGGTGVARLVVNSMLTVPFSASSTDDSGIEMVDEESESNNPLPSNA